MPPPHEDWQGTAGWRLSNSPWNLQVIARSAGSLTRFMPDDVPGVTSPMVYVGMLFSWFAWHVEDHELHSMNYLHMGSPKTWYAVPGEFATTLEDIVRTQAYGGNMDHLAAFTMLGEKTTLISPQVFAAAGVPCCRLVQHPGEFVITFPRAYHVGFSHGFNCGEAANFATPQWLTVAKEAAVRRAATNHLPMLSHQQLLYILTMSFIYRIPRELSGLRSSRLQDRKKEDTECLVKKSFLTDITRENHLLHLLLDKESTSYAVLWEPELLPSSCITSRPFSSSLAPEANGAMDCGRRMGYNTNVTTSFDCKRGNYSTGSMVHEVCSNLTTLPCQDISSVDTPKAAYRVSNSSSNTGTIEGIDVEEGDLPIGLSVDSGSLPCISCGILGYPFMAVIQPSERALSELFSGNYEEFHQKLGKPRCPNLYSSMPSKARKLNSEATTEFEVQGNPDSTLFYPAVNGHLLPKEGPDTNCSFTLLDSKFKDTSSNIVKMQDAAIGHQMESTSNRVFQSGNDLLNKIKYSNCLHHGQLKELNKYMHMKDTAIAENDSSCTNFSGNRYEINSLLGAPGTKSGHLNSRKWNKSHGFMRPRIFCLQHALEIVELLQCKGGANVLITCHSDFVRIKEHALAVAEEIGVPFKYKDIQLEDASPDDLDLICFSIDDDAHNESGEDWTSKLGLNLKYCLKMRKHTPLNKDCLTLGLGRLFSDTLPVSVGSGLKWHSRKSRTPYKIIGSVHPKPPCNATMEKAKQIINRSNDSSMKKIQVYHSRGSGSSDMTKKPHDCETNAVSSEFSSCRETGIVIDWDVDRSFSNHSYILNKEMGKDNAESMLAIPFLNADQTRMRQDDWSAETVSIPSDASAAKPEDLSMHADTANEPHRRQLNTQLLDKFNNVEADCDPMNSERHGPYDKYSTNGKSELPCIVHSSTEPNTNCKTGTSDTETVALRNYSEDLHKLGQSVIYPRRNNLVPENLTIGDNRIIDSHGKQQKSSLNSEMEQICNSSDSVESLGHILNATAVVKISGRESQASFSEEVGLTRPVDHREIPSTAVPSSAGKVSETHGVAENTTRVNDHAYGTEKNISKVTRLVFKSYVRRNKKKSKVEQIITDSHSNNNIFVRSPCEGLRPRSRQVAERAEARTVNEVTVKGTERAGSTGVSYECDLEGCHMTFTNRGELMLHKRNHSANKRRRKQLSSQQCAIDDGRPLKCPWKGCSMSFKWAWARTEHLRFHTGERPYKCKGEGCGLTFQFVSDFSRHRRKSGHSASSPD